MKLRKVKLNVILKKQSAFTLIELLISLSLFSVILLLIGLFFYGGTRSFANGHSTASLQANSRVTMQSLQNEIRNSRELELTYVSDIDIDPEDEYNYIWVKDGLIMISKYSNGNERNVTKLPGNYLESDIFSKYDSSLLKITLTGEEKGKNYIIESIVSLLNIEYSNSTISVTENTSGQAIKYADISFEVVSNNPDPDPDIPDIPDDTDDSGDTEDSDDPDLPEEDIEYPLYDHSKVYEKGDKVLYNGNKYTAMWYSKGNYPAQNVGQWHQVTDYWVNTNVYDTGDVVIHENYRWRANYHSVGVKPHPSKQEWARLEKVD